jgi:hypothetical protein
VLFVAKITFLAAAKVFAVTAESESAWLAVATAETIDAPLPEVIVTLVIEVAFAGVATRPVRASAAAAATAISFLDI